MDITPIIVTMVRESGNIRMMRRIIPPTDQVAISSLQVIPVLGARQNRIGNNVFRDMQFKPANQRQDASHVTLVSIDFLKSHI